MKGQSIGAISSLKLHMHQRPPEWQGYVVRVRFDTKGSAQCFERRHKNHMIAVWNRTGGTFVNVATPTRPMTFRRQMH